MRQAKSGRPIAASSHPSAPWGRGHHRKATPVQDKQSDKVGTNLGDLLKGLRDGKKS